MMKIQQMYSERSGKLTYIVIQSVMPMQQPLSATSLDAFWSLDKKDALQILSCTEKGLPRATAEERLKTYGPNTLKGASRSSPILLFLSQFKSPLTLLLVAAAFLSMGLGDITDAIIILIIVLISSFLGFWQKRGAAHAVGELLKMVQIRCRSIREGTESEFSMYKLGRAG